MPISTPTLNPHPFPSNWGRKRIYVLHGLWVILCCYSLDGSRLRGVASLLHCGRTPLVGLKLRIFPKMPKMTSRGQRPPFRTPLVKNPQNEPPRSKTPTINPRGQNHPNLPLDQKSPNDPRGQKPPKLTPLVKNPQNEPPRSKTPKFTPLTKNPPNDPPWSKTPFPSN